MNPTRRSLLPAGLALAGFGWMASGRAAAQPRPALTPSVSAQTVRSHDFRAYPFVSADGLRRYRIEVAVPKAPPPARGYPLLALCDGNAAFMTLTPADLEAVPGLVLVALGYARPSATISSRATTTTRHL